MKVPYGYLDRQFKEEVAEKIWQERVKSVVTRGDFTLGKEVKEFEQNFAKAIGAKFCLGVANGTDALELAIWSLNLPPGSEIIVPCDTFVASAACIVTQGHKPVFVDVNNKYVLDADKIEAAITFNTRAILPVHFAGQPCDMEKITAIAKKHGLKIIEDAAQAADAISNAGPCGAVGDVAEVSFHPQKNLNAWGDAGAFLTNDDAIYERVKLYRNHGMLTRDDYAFASRNSRLDTTNAAVLDYLLPDLHRHNDIRIKVAKRYSDAFRPFVTQVPDSNQGERHTYHLYMMRVQEECRDQLLSYLIGSGIDARIHYPKPLHLQPAFEFLGYKKGDFPVAEQYAKEKISLPIHQFMREEEIDYTIHKVTDFLTGKRTW